MSSYVIRGKRPLRGRVAVEGSKNAALPILAATLLVEEPVTIQNCPELMDVRHMLSILETLGATSLRTDRGLVVDTRAAARWVMPEPLSRRLRSSFFMLGSTLGRFGRATFTYPGGCEIGSRPVDLHLYGLRRLGVRVEEDGKSIHCDGSAMRGADIHLDYPSVGATENLMMAAVCATGTTVITNAAREPEICDLQAFLNRCGARVEGAGGSRVTVRGLEPGEKLRGCVHAVIPDRIVAGTYMCAAAITGGEVTVGDVCPEHIASVTHRLREMGCDVAVCGAKRGDIAVRGPERLRFLPRLETAPYPGFPTDMQALLLAVTTVARGKSVIVENVFDSRFRHAAELTRMGANIALCDRVAVVRGVEELRGAQVFARDLRGGAALVLAALAARGKSVVRDICHIQRGYADMAGALAALGADICEAPGERAPVNFSACAGV